MKNWHCFLLVSAILGAQSMDSPFAVLFLLLAVISAMFS